MTLRELAYHEGGHAVVAWLCEVPVYSASIVEPDGGGLVRHAVAHTWETGLMIVLAGRVAEILGGAHVSTHPGSDTEASIELCRRANIPDDAIPATCRACEADIRWLLGRHRGWLDATADALLRRGVLSGCDVLACDPHGTEAPEDAAARIVSAYVAWRDPAVVEREREQRETEELLESVQRLLADVERRKQTERRPQC